VPKETKALNEVAKTKMDPIPRLGITPSPEPRKRLQAARVLSDNDQDAHATMTPERKAMMQAEDEKKLKEREEKHAKLEAGKKTKGKPGEKTPVKPDADDPKTYDEMRDMLEGKPDPAAVEEDARKKKKDKKVDEDVPKYPEPDPPGPITFNPAKKEDLAKVIAGLKAEEQVTATDILDEIRKTVVSKVLIGPQLAEPPGDPDSIRRRRRSSRRSTKNSPRSRRAPASPTKKPEAQRGAEGGAEAAARRGGEGTTQEQMEANRAAREKAKEQEAEIAARKEAADRKAGKIKKAAPKAKLAMNIDARRARLLGYVTADVADLVVKAKQKGEIRDSAVARMVRDYTDAYKFAAQQDLYDIRSKVTDPKVATSAATGAEEEKVRKWRDDAVKGVEKFKTDQKKTDDANVELQGQVRVAGDAKGEAIRAWAERSRGRSAPKSRRRPTGRSPTPSGRKPGRMRSRSSTTRSSPAACRRLRGHGQDRRASQAGSRQRDDHRQPAPEPGADRDARRLHEAACRGRRSGVERRDGRREDPDPATAPEGRRD
jgi:hypothetical protein